MTRLTERLVLRQWRDEDLEPFARLNADPEVMRYFPAPLDREQSDAMVTRMRERIGKRGMRTPRTSRFGRAAHSTGVPGMAKVRIV